MFTPNRGDCKDCKEHYDFKYKTIPPCETSGKCPFGKPMLTTRNAWVFDFYQKCSSQQIVAGMGTPIGIMFTSIVAILDIYNIVNVEDRIEIFEKIQLIDSIRLKLSHQETIGKRNLQKH